MTKHRHKPSSLVAQPHRATPRAPGATARSLTMHKATLKTQDEQNYASASCIGAIDAQMLTTNSPGIYAGGWARCTPSAECGTQRSSGASPRPKTSAAQCGLGRPPIVDCAFALGRGRFFGPFPRHEMPGLLPDFALRSPVTICVRRCLNLGCPGALCH